MSQVNSLLYCLRELGLWACLVAFEHVVLSAVDKVVEEEEEEEEGKEGDVDRGYEEEDLALLGALEGEEEGEEEEGSSDGEVEDGRLGESEPVWDDGAEEGAVPYLDEDGRPVTAAALRRRRAELR